MAGTARDIDFTVSENREQDVYINCGTVFLPSIKANSSSTA
jgi:hypothetical protein